MTNPTAPFDIESALASGDVTAMERRATPRTDECVRELLKNCLPGLSYVEYSLIDHARTLERENAGLRAALQAVVALDQDGMVATGRPLHDAIAKARAALAAAKGKGE